MHFLYKYYIVVDYCDVLISCLDSLSDGTHSLRDVMLHLIKSVLIKKQTHLLLGWKANIGCA